jgi:hypothetical protein
VLAPGFTFRVPGFGRERLLNKEEFFELIFEASPATPLCPPPNQRAPDALAPASGHDRTCCLRFRTSLSTPPS